MRVYLMKDAETVAREFRSMQEAADFAGIAISTLSQAFHQFGQGFLAKAGGYLWDRDWGGGSSGLMRCPACEKWLSKTRFYRVKSRSTGLSWACAECEKARTRRAFEKRVGGGSADDPGAVEDHVEVGGGDGSCAGELHPSVGADQGRADGGAGGPDLDGRD
jgi:transposase-like protein